MNLLRKKHCLNCDLLKHSLHFFYDEIRCCCSNAKGPVLYPNYDGSDIDWDYIYKVRKSYIKKLNSIFNRMTIPPECENCFEIPNYMTDKKIEPFPNVVKKVYFQNYMSCNANCTYCIFKEKERGFRYKVVPIVRSMIENNILSENASVYMSGGETTMSPEFEELLSLLIPYLNGRIEIFTSGIKYCKSIEDAFIQNKLSMLISIDSGSRETYQKIKLVDAFDIVVNNLKQYVEASDNAKKNITLKYILVDDVNDNIEELSKFFRLVEELEIKNVRLDVNFQKYSLYNKQKVPPFFSELYDYFKTRAKELNCEICSYDQINAILNKN